MLRGGVSMASELYAVPPELFERLAAALAEARSLLRSYHGEPGWSEYQQSPEMRRINGAMDASYKMSRGAAPSPDPVVPEQENS